MNALNKPTPPHSPEAERAVLGAMLFDNDAFDVVTCAPICLVTADFYLSANRLIMAAVTSLRTSGKPVDALTVGDWLRASGDLEAAGGFSAIVNLDAPTDAFVRSYAQQVKDYATRRRVAAFGTALAAEAMGPVTDVAAMVASASSRILAIGDDSADAEMTPAKDVMIATFKSLEAASNSPDAVRGVPTGFAGLDGLLAGLHEEDYVILAGRPSMGKSALALNIVETLSVDHGVCTGYWSLEMSKGALMTRMVGGRARVNLNNMRTGRLAPQDWLALSVAAGKISDAPLFINDRSTLSLAQFSASCRRMKRDNKLRVAVIDYVQLMDMSTSDHNANRAQVLGDISKGLKAVARELKITVVALAQLNRGLENRTDKRPMMSDLRESGALEQDADVIAFLYRDEYYNKDSADKGKAEVIIAKQRNGGTATVELAFLPHLTRFENLYDDGITVSTQPSLRLPRPSGGSHYNPDDAERDK